ncbi:MAG: PilZ domain-containing protein [Desulfobulbaceae bacterium]|nr:PilZ domain-containing protein [Desulfobulbaceae bacterium]MCK5339855.1 PilZ domain-containing protein [Desulfobulbaceae bacterium]MCK5405415.1 PilZ domain-containing protein [Desulfobulbaceae bacterium]
MSSSAGVFERRKQKRFSVAQSYTINSAKPGMIVDVNMEGLAVRYIDRKSFPKESYTLDISQDDTGFSLKDLPYEIVTDDVTTHQLSDRTLVIKRMGVKFNELSEQQKGRLESFIRNYSRDSS